MLGTRWETVLENVRTFISVRDEHAAQGGNRCRVTFQLTFMEVNYAELPDVVILAAEIGVERVKATTCGRTSPRLRTSPCAAAPRPSPGGTPR